MKKRIFRKNLFRLTGAAMTTVMVLGSTVQAWAKSGGNEIISADNVAGGGSSTDDYYSNVDLDDYDSWLRDLISECISKSDSKEDYLPGGVYHDTHVRQEHYEFNEPRLEDGSWQFDVEEWGVSVTDPVNYERDDGNYTRSQTNRYNDTISIVDLSHSWENYSEQAYQIFLPIEGKLSVNHYINSDSYRRAFDEGGSINVYHPWYDETRHDGCTYTINEFSDYLKETEKTIEVDSSNALTKVIRDQTEVGARTGRFVAELTNTRTGELITAETLVLKDINGTPRITFSGLPDGDYTVTWYSEHDAWFYTYEQWYCEMYVYVKETKRALLSYASYYEKTSDRKYTDSYWMQDEIQPYSFSMSGGGDVIITDGGEASTWELIK